jgi:hypothetical protein
VGVTGWDGATLYDVSIDLSAPSVAVTPLGTALTPSGAPVTPQLGNGAAWAAGRAWVSNYRGNGSLETGSITPIGGGNASFAFLNGQLGLNVEALRTGIDNDTVGGINRAGDAQFGDLVSTPGFDLPFLGDPNTGGIDGYVFSNVVGMGTRIGFDPLGTAVIIDAIEASDPNNAFAVDDALHLSFFDVSGIFEVPQVGAALGPAIVDTGTGDVVTSAHAGFTVDQPTGLGILSTIDPAAGLTVFWSVDMDTGAATRLGTFAGQIDGLASVVPSPAAGGALALACGALAGRRRR